MCEVSFVVPLTITTQVVATHGPTWGRSVRSVIMVYSYHQRPLDKPDSGEY